ncbi:hypothetical protein N7478_006937 [Penicillium angulare]|uniref:uncharacterized protein n=1 Tax=Penicillium angulare TaxID=116970 RepID=UPI002540C157|nr:uncharacterized protein N7478_006937 [Penicillium angulare]KAJ5281565.1 hypothetical protein N7478_006937 [Penicillium angulare]
MRLSRPLHTSIRIYNTLISFPRYKSTSSTPESAFASPTWLSARKASELQQLARATGIQSSGTKSVLTQRISSSFLNQHHQTNNPNDPWRVLSIDMGIQNLAFAHLVVPCPFSMDIHTRTTSPVTPPALTAWRRVAVSEFTKESDLSSKIGSEIQQTQTESTSALEFTPALYAETAYKLITTLLSTYNPTHIIIERQRFRSGGGSAVQEWTIRVGVFEGMLYAVLRALKAERGYGPFVEGVEPKRVVGYLGEREREGREAKTAREVKKMKIDVVGRWLDREANADANRVQRVLVGEELDADMVDGYLRRWKGVRTKGGAGAGSKIGKLDDLADCLLQGVTWLEWQVMRERLVREGMGALDSLEPEGV